MSAAQLLGTHRAVGVAVVAVIVAPARDLAVVLGVGDLAARRPSARTLPSWTIGPFFELIDRYVSFKNDVQIVDKLHRLLSGQSKSRTVYVTLDRFHRRIIETSLLYRSKNTSHGFYQEMQSISRA